MNLREGTRRVALLLGAVGAILGGIASYLVLQPAIEQRSSYNRFERLANSKVVQQERKSLQAEPNDWQTVPTPQIDPKTVERIQAAPEFIPDDPIQDFIALPLDKQLSMFKELPPNKQDKLLVQLRKRRSQNPSAPQNAQSVPRFGPPVQPNDLVAWSATGRPVTSQPNKAGIKNIHWTENFGVESIETEGGETLYPTPAPSAWTFLLVAVFPCIGFLIPWGTVRAIGWVGAGFAASPK